jgi:inorganic triphosphatase YgiF
VEFEHQTGDRRAVFALARDWIAPGRLWLNHLSKAQRGTSLASGRLTDSAKKAHQPAVDRTEDGGRLLVLVLRSTLEQVLVNASEVAIGSDDEEHVHQLRVGLRRTRTALRDLCPRGMAPNPAWEPTADPRLPRTRHRARQCHRG